MKAAIAQLRPVAGAVEQNLDGHLALSDLAARSGAGLVVFPELSLTGYEPRRAAELARNQDDRCFDCLQAASDRHDMTIAVGVPVQCQPRPTIATLVFRPHSDKLIYCKTHLHPDEEPFFAPAENSSVLIDSDPPVALAICYELSIPQHAQQAAAEGASVYVASVAKTARGVEQASRRLSELAREHSMFVLMSNCLGWLDGADCTGRTSVWDRDGNLMMQLDSETEGVLVLDTETGDVQSAV